MSLEERKVFGTGARPSMESRAGKSTKTGDKRKAEQIAAFMGSRGDSGAGAEGRKVCSAAYGQFSLL